MTIIPPTKSKTVELWRWAFKYILDALTSTNNKIFKSQDENMILKNKPSSIHVIDLQNLWEIDFIPENDFKMLPPKLANLHSKC